MWVVAFTKEYTTYADTELAAKVYDWLQDLIRKHKIRILGFAASYISETASIKLEGYSTIEWWYCFSTTNAAYIDTLVVLTTDCGELSPREMTEISRVIKYSNLKDVFVVGSSMYCHWEGALQLSVPYLLCSNHLEHPDCLLHNTDVGHVIHSVAKKIASYTRGY